MSQDDSLKPEEVSKDRSARPEGEGNKSSAWLSRLSLFLLDLNRNLLAFCLAMWAVVALAFGAIFTKAIFGKPSTPLYYLFAAVIVASCLAVFAASGIMSRLRKVGFRGFEVELGAEAKLAAEMLQYKEIVPSNMEAFQKGEHRADSPFPTLELTGPQRYHYERLSHRLYQIFDTTKNPMEVDLESREYYRSLIKHVGKAAFVMKHYTKSLDILRHLESFRDKELDAYELTLLGTAYLWAGDEVGEVLGRTKYWEKSLTLLLDAKKKNPYDEHMLYNLGWILFSLDKYDAAVEQFEECVKHNRAVAPWAKWNIACAYVKLGNKPRAGQILREIPSGPWWGPIAEDSDFTALKNDPEFGEAFRDLCRERQQTVR